MPGQPLEQVSLQATASGNTILLPAVSRARYKLFNCTITVNADIIGEVILTLGVTLIYSVLNPKAGAIYGFNLNPNFIQSEENVNLVINLPSTTTTDVVLTYEKVTALERD